MLACLPLKTVACSNRCSCFYSPQHLTAHNRLSRAVFMLWPRYTRYLSALYVLSLLISSTHRWLRTSGAPVAIIARQHVGENECEQPRILSMNSFASLSLSRHPGAVAQSLLQRSRLSTAFLSKNKRQDSDSAGQLMAVFLNLKSFVV